MRGRILPYIYSLSALSDLRFNITLWTAVIAWAAAQLIKTALEYSRTKKINYSLLFGTGGMPSSHCAFVSAMTTAVGIRNGFDSSVFALCCVFSMVVMYDAAGVRRAAGQQAEIINQLVEAIENSGIKMDRKLKELLGHSPIEVAAGAVLGIVAAVIAARLMGA